MYYYSFSRGGFIPAAWKDDGTYTELTWPSDAVLCTEEELATYKLQDPPAGMMLGGDENGRPIWLAIPPVVVPLSEAQDKKRTEMRDACSNEITRSSYQSDALGAVHNYDCRIVDQLNLKIRYDVALSTSAPEPIWASDGTRYQWLDHTAAEIMDVMIDMNEHVKAAQVLLASKLAAVDAATTTEQVNLIEW